MRTKKIKDESVRDHLFRLCIDTADEFHGDGCLIIIMDDNGFRLGACGVKDGDAPDILRALASCLDESQAQTGTLQ